MYARVRYEFKTDRLSYTRHDSPSLIEYQLEDVTLVFTELELIRNFLQNPDDFVPYSAIAILLS